MLFLNLSQTPVYMDSLKEVGLKTIILEVLGLMLKQYEMISNTSVGCTLS